MCVSVKSHLTLGASVRSENAVMNSVGDEGRNICGVFSDTAPLPRSSAASLGWPYIRSAIFLRITRMRIVHAQVLQSSRWILHAVSSPCVLAYDNGEF